MNRVDLKGKLPLVASGKVRELYELPGDRLLFVATDRISAYDVIMNNGIPNKGKLLTSLSRFWFSYLQDVVPNHLVDKGNPLTDGSLPSNITSDQDIVDQLAGRSLVVNKYKIIPLEVIVRGYLTGSAWAEYQAKGTVHGEPVRAGMQESEAFDEPIFTPSTKAEAGQHDENISKARAAEIVGSAVLESIEPIALELYRRAHAYALTRGIIIADTKFEFGLDNSGRVVLVDEVLTPDSSRFWPKEGYSVGRGQDSFDKQFLRNWLVSQGLKAKPDITVPGEIIERTKSKYEEVYAMLVPHQP